MSDHPFPSLPKAWLSPDEFTMRREIVPATSERGPSSRSKNLPAVFQDAHPWPLQWGGAEVKEGRFYAHQEFNGGAQKTLENAGLRLAQSAQGTDAKIGCTIAVRKYAKHGQRLLESATYKFEAAVKEGNTYKKVWLGEITIHQSLTEDQRAALVRGKRLSAPTDPVQRIEVSDGKSKKVVVIDPRQIVRIPADTTFMALDDRLAAFLNGLRTKGSKPESERAKRIRKAERDEIRTADKESRARTAATPAGGSPATQNKATQNNGVASGRPLAGQSTKTSFSPALAATSAANTSTFRGTAPPAAAVPSLGQALQSAPRGSPSGEQLKLLHSALGSGQTEVKSTGGSGVKVTLRRPVLGRPPPQPGRGLGTVARVGSGAARVAPTVTGLLNIIDERIPVVDPVSIMQAVVEKRATLGIDNGVKWLAQNFPPAEQVLQTRDALSMRHSAALQALASNAGLWREQLRPGTRHGHEARAQADRNVTRHLDAIETYLDHLESPERLQAVEYRQAELDPVREQVRSVESALDRLANELEEKTWIAIKIPAGYYFGVELFGLAQWVRKMSGIVSRLIHRIDDIDREYSRAIDQARAMSTESNRVVEEWKDVLVESQKLAIP